MDFEEKREVMDHKELRKLKKARYELMEEIHQKQQKLNEIDYLIYQKKKEGQQ